MRIAWFTPLDKKSGITRYSLSAINALSGMVDIDVWTVRKQDKLPIESVEVHEAALSEENIRDLAGYDAVIYNMGNNVDFHYEIYEFYKRVKGVVILHDVVLHHFFVELFLTRLQRPNNYLSIMEHCYGAKGKEIGEKSLSIPLHVWETEDVADYPLFEPMLWNAYGVVVHSMDSLDRVRRASCVPSKRIYHPFYQYPENDSCLSREDLEIPDGKVVLLQYGHIVPNKNVHKLIEAICEYPETRDRVHLVVAGDYDNTYGKNIKSLIQDKGLNDVVTLAGHVSDSVLHSYIKNADLCINLRFPSTEGVSGSLIEQLYFRKPVVAAEVGFYAEMPDECILKLDSPISTKELADAVKFLVGDRNFRETLATKGGDFAHQYFSPEVYAKDLLRFIKEALSFKTSLDFIDRISGEISKFITSTTSEYFIGNISKELYSICDNQKRGTHLIV